MYCKPVAIGYVEHDPTNADWFRSVDPHFTGEPEKPKRITAKRALRELLDALETPDADFPAALAQACKLAA